MVREIVPRNGSSPVDVMLLTTWGCCCASRRASCASRRGAGWRWGRSGAHILRFTQEELLHGVELVRPHPPFRVAQEPVVLVVPVRLSVGPVTVHNLQVHCCYTYSSDGNIAAFPHNIKECRTDVKVVRHCASQKSKCSTTVICNSKMMAVIIFQGPIFESRELTGPPFHNFKSITDTEIFMYE